MCILNSLSPNCRIFVTLESHNNKQLDLVFNPFPNLVTTNFSISSLPYVYPYISYQPNQVVCIVRIYHTNLFMLCSLAGTQYMSLLLEFYLTVKAHFKNQQFHKTFLVVARNVSCQVFQVLLEVEIIMG